MIRTCILFIFLFPLTALAEPEISDVEYSFINHLEDIRKKGAGERGDDGAREVQFFHIFSVDDEPLFEEDNLPTGFVVTQTFVNSNPYVVRVRANYHTSPGKRVSLKCRISWESDTGFLIMESCLDQDDHKVTFVEEARTFTLYQ